MKAAGRLLWLFHVVALKQFEAQREICAVSHRGYKTFFMLNPADHEICPGKALSLNFNNLVTIKRF